MKSIHTLLKEIETQGAAHPLLKEGLSRWIVSEFISLGLMIVFFLVFILIFSAGNAAFSKKNTKEPTIAALYARTQSHLCTLHQLAEKESSQQRVAATDLTHPAKIREEVPIAALQSVLKNASGSPLFHLNDCREEQE